MVKNVLRMTGESAQQSICNSFEIGREAVSTGVVRGELQASGSWRCLGRWLRLYAHRHREYNALSEHFVHGEHVNFVNTKNRLHLGVAHDLPPVVRVLEFMALDIHPQLLYNLGSRELRGVNNL